MGPCCTQRLALGQGAPISNREEEVLTAAQHSHETEPPAAPPRLWNSLAWGTAPQAPPDPRIRITPVCFPPSVWAWHTTLVATLLWPVQAGRVLWAGTAAVHWHSCGSKGSPRAPSAQSPGPGTLPAQGTAAIQTGSPQTLHRCPPRGRGRPQCPVVLDGCRSTVSRSPSTSPALTGVQPRAVGPSTYRRAAGALGRGSQSPSAHTVPSCWSLRASDRDKDFNGNNRKQLLSSDRGCLNYRRRVKNEIT